MNEHEPMFEQHPDPEHIKMLRKLVRGWIELQKLQKVHVNEDLMTINPEALTPDDLLLYQEYVNKQLTTERFLAYKEKVLTELRKNGDNRMENSRATWLSHLSSLMAAQQMREGLRKLKEMQ
jgi:hypothetical protein